MSQSLEQKIQQLNAQFTAKMQELQAQGRFNEIGALAQELQASIDELVQAETAQAFAPPTLSMVQDSPYHHDDCGISLDQFVYDGDRDYFAELMKHPVIASFKAQEAQALGGAPDMKRELIKRALRLTKVMAPKVYRAVERCQERLGFRPELHVYVAQDPHMNAFCYPPQHGAVHVLFTSALLEKLNEDELTFVLGHELGHYLYKHHELNPRALIQHAGAGLTPAEGIKLFAWQRNAELSADRIGLLACENYEAACLANFKISSGVSSDALLFSLESYIQQYQEMEQDIASGQATVEDLYSTHPINPLRVLALDIFQRSETFRNQVPNCPGEAEYTEQQMEERIAGFMRLMEPSFLTAGPELAQKIKGAMFLAGYAIALADGEVEPEEMAYLMSILPGENHAQLQSRLEGRGLDELLATLAEQVEDIRPHMNEVSCCNFIRDLVTIAVADGELAQNEVKCLVEICGMFRIHPAFIDHVLNALATQAAA